MRAKRLPKGFVCDGCGGPCRSLPSAIPLDRGVYCFECKAGCWVCECGETHPASFICFALTSENYLERMRYALALARGVPCRWRPG